jgi:hypothetical protein
MSSTDIDGIAGFDRRLWDIHRLLMSGDQERARVECALLAADAGATGADWVEEELQALWAPQGGIGHARSA